jgi:CDGSH-type Zn-finger protein
VPLDETLAPSPAGDAADVTDATVRDLPPAAEPTATITPYRDGPLIVRGDFRLTDTEGNEIDPGRKTVALCRCGKSGIKPFCDGTHKRSGFSAPSAPSRPRPAAQLLREARREDGTA